MTYLVLARKWRPRSFDTLVGQDHVVRALTSALSTGRLHHAWLFTGTRGVGKTTLSRILAKALNCVQGVTPTPCGVCEACVGIEADRFVDYLELDAASNRGVEDMSRLLDQAVYAPTAGRYKVYMIDEVHMLTGHAFNAMLKTLEEPPAHVKFILATTDPQKIPVTVLSRCLQFNLKQMPPQAVAGHLSRVLEAEGVPTDPEALRLLGQAARGSMRDGLSLTDQAIAYGGGQVGEASVREMLGVIDQTYLVRLLLALVANNGNAVLEVANELSQRGLSYAAALDDLAGLLAQVAMAQRIPGLPTDDHPQADDIRQLAAAMPADAVQLFYSIALHSRQELALAPDEHAGFIMTCLRMLAFVTEGGSAAAGSAAPSSEPDAGGPAGSGNRFSAGAPAAASGGSTAAPESVAGSVVAAASAPSNSTEGVAAARAVLAGLRSGLRGGAPERPAAAKEAAAPLAPAAAPSASVASSAPAAPLAVSSPAVRTSAPVTTSPPRAPSSSESSSAVSEAEFASMPVPPPEDEIDLPWYDDEPDVPPAGRAQAPVASAQRPGQAQRQSQDQGQGQGHAQAQGRAHVHAQTQLASTPTSLPAPPRTSELGSEPRTASQSESTALSTVSLEQMRPADWPAVVVALPLAGPSAALAYETEWVAYQAPVLTLRLASLTLAQGIRAERLRQALAERFGVPIELDFQAGPTGAGTANAVAQSQREARQREAEAAIAADPFVQSLVDEFDGQILPGSIQPL